LKVAPQRTRHLAPGDKLGTYEVIRQIAVGGMAELYLARTLGIEGFEKVVVVKRILPQYLGHASFVEMFLHEARLAATLHHVNIAQVYDIGVEDGDYFFAMEYLPGQDLDHVTVAAEEQGVPLSIDAALTLVSGLSAGLHYAHERTAGDGTPMDIVHRDVSPSNVLVSYDGAVKLVDFGIAHAASRPGKTQGGLKGKICYMSPEQCRAKATLDRRSDLYSVGTILYELTAGRPPFTGETEYQILHQIVNEDAPPPSTFVPGYPVELERIVLRALARDPDRRYATALELQVDVESFAHAMQLRISPLVLARVMNTLFGEHGSGYGVDDEKTAFDEPAFGQPEQGDAPPDPSAFALTESAVGADPMAALVPSAASPAYERTESVIVPLPAAPAHGAARPSAAASPAFAVPAPPEPAKPTPYPIVSDLITATPGALVTAAGKYGGLPKSTAGRNADPTERVRLAPRRAPSPTTFVRNRPGVPVLMLAGFVLAGAAVAAVIALRPAAAPRSSAAPAPESVEPAREQMQVVPTVPPQDDVEVAQPAPTPARPLKPASANPAITKPAAAKPAPANVVTATKRTAKSAPATRASRPQGKPSLPNRALATTSKPSPPNRALATTPKPKRAAKPKETTWNADSPFMPVRPSK